MNLDRNTFSSSRSGESSLWFLFEDDFEKQEESIKDIDDERFLYVDTFSFKILNNY